MEGNVLQSALGVLAFRDVGLRSRHPGRSPGRVMNGESAGEHPAVRAVLVQHPVLVLEVRKLSFQMGIHVHLHLHPIPRVHPAEPLLLRGSDLLLPIAQHRFPARGVIHRVCLEVPVPQPVVRAARGQSIPLFALPQRLCRLLPLQGIADRPPQQIAANVPLVQIVLRTPAYRGRGQILVGQTGQHDERNLRGPLVSAFEGLDPAAVRKRQVQQDDLDTTPVQRRQPLRESVRPDDIELCTRDLRQHVAHQIGITGVVLDQQCFSRFR